ncbi:MAG: DUF3137 domain-containing protein [Pseudomonadota bacterium]
MLLFLFFVVVAIVAFGLLIFKPAYDRARDPSYVPPQMPEQPSSLHGLKGLLVDGNTTAVPDNASIDPRIAAHYESTIRPLTAAFEASRKAALRIMRKRVLIAISLVLIFWMLPELTPPWVNHVLLQLIYGVGKITAIFMAVATLWPTDCYEGSIREKVFPEVFRFFGPQWHYRTGDGLGAQDMNIVRMIVRYVRRPRQVVHMKKPLSRSTRTTRSMVPYEAYGIIPYHTRAKITDYLDGSYKDVPITLVQCTLDNTYGEGATTVFEGLLITMDVPKPFSGHTVIRRDYGRVLNWLARQRSTLKPVHLEDPRFEKKYEALSTDQVQARHLLKPRFIERLMALEQQMGHGSFRGKCALQCAFLDGKMLLMLPMDKPWFSTGSVFKRATFIADINSILAQMDQLFGIVDVLQLDSTTGL